MPNLRTARLKCRGGRGCQRFDHIIVVRRIDETQVDHHAAVLWLVPTMAEPHLPEANSLTNSSADKSRGTIETTWEASW